MLQTALATENQARVRSPFLATARPRQWIKNVLVFAAPAAAGAMLRPATLAATGLALAAFILASVSTYFINDAADVHADRAHPVKSRRPVAAGLISPRRARLSGLAVAAAALLLAAAVNLPFAGCVAGYLALTVTYSSVLKNIAVLDVLAVAGGFVLRAAGGAAATRVPMSNWFLLTTLLGALYLVTAKRLGEHSRELRRPPHWTGRTVLASYSGPWLQQILTMTLTGTVLAYAGWAFGYRGRDIAMPLLAISFVPFLAGLMRYSLLVSRGDGEVPENLLTGDRFLLLAGVLWSGTAAAAVYLG